MPDRASEVGGKWVKGKATWKAANTQREQTHKDVSVLCVCVEKFFKC